MDLHYSCRNCSEKARVDFKNKSAFCFGLVSKPAPACDYFRICLIKNKTKHVTDIMIEEALCYLYGISTSLIKFLESYRIKTTKIIKESS